MKTCSTLNGLVTTARAAQILSLSRGMVYRLMAHGDLAFVKIGRSRRIAVSELARFIARHTIQGRAKR